MGINILVFDCNFSKVIRIKKTKKGVRVTLKLRKDSPALPNAPFHT